MGIENSALPSGTEEQTIALANAQRTITQLDSIIANQKSDVAERQRAIDRLKVEHDQIAKVLSAERASIDAVFEEQRAKNQRDV